MPTLTSQPSTTDLHAAYGSSLTYRLTQVYTPSDPIPAIEARITINGSLFSTLYYPATSASGVTAVFEININGVVQEFFSSQAAYPGTFTGYANVDLEADCVAAVSVSFYTWSANASGLLALTGSPATSATSKTINSAQSDLSDFYAATGRKFLTNKPDHVTVKTNEGELVAIYSTVLTPQLVLKTYNASGLQGTYTKTLDGTGTRLVVIGIGIPNLLAMQTDGWTSEVSTGGDMMDGGTSTYYTIEVKQSGGATFSEIRTYHVDNSSDCIAYRLFFLNILGFYDAVSLYSSTFNNYGTNSIQFESPISATNPNPANRLYSKLTNGFAAHFLGLTDEEQTWLKELANTVDAYETSLDNPIIVEDAEFVEKDTYAAMNETLLRFTYSNKVYSQRN